MPSDSPLGTNIEAPPMPQRGRRAPKTATQRQMTRIVLEEGDHIPKTGLFLNVNNKSFMLLAGVEADVPDEVLNVLDDAVMSTPIVDPITLEITGYTNRQRYPYRLVRDRNRGRHRDQDIED